MTTLFLQKQNGTWHPHSEEDKIESMNYKENQVVGFQVVKDGAKKLRSLQQHRMYWGLIETVFSNTEKFKSEIQLSEYVKLKAGHVDSVVFIDGKEHIVTASISFDKMNHAKACLFINKSIEILAEVLGVEEFELLNNYDKG